MGYSYYEENKTKNNKQNFITFLFVSISLALQKVLKLS